jgi:hypothetical protein
MMHENMIVLLRLLLTGRRNACGLMLFMTDQVSEL